jgi:hypothetical protein
MANSEIISAGNNATKMMHWNEKFTFGKHKGKTVIHLMHYDYRYLWWIYIKGIRTFDDCVINNVKESLEFDANCCRVSRAQGVYGGADDYESMAQWL